LRAISQLPAPKAIPKIAPGLSKMAAALEYGKAGIPCFPCVEDGKQPATDHGFKDATTDLAQIAAWWAENPNYNIALCPEDAGWCVVDIDPGGETPWIEVIKKEGGHEPTYEVATPRGGKHLYFKGSIATSASKLGAHVDTRGVKGYVLVPPSVVGGKSYKVTNDRAIAPLPGWIATQLAAKNAAPREAPANVELDRDIAVAAYRSDLKTDLANNGPPLDGLGSDDRTYSIIGRGRDLNLSDERIGDLLHDVWAPHFTRDWLDTKIANAAKYAQNARGCDAPRTIAEAFGPAIEKLGLNKPAAAANDNDAEPEDEPEGADESWRDLVARLGGIKPTDGAKLPALVFFDAHGFYQRTLEGSVMLLYGPFGGGKSTIAICDLMVMIKAHIDSPENVRPIRVAYGAGEGWHGVVKNRVPSIAAAFGIPLDVLDKFWRTVPLPDLTNKRHVKAAAYVWSRAFDGLPATHVVVDTLHSSSGTIDENTDAIGKLIGGNGPVARLKRALKDADGFCGNVLVIDHTGKDSSKGARGHSSKSGDVDTLVEITEFDRKAGRAAKWLEKQKDGEDKFAVDYSLTTTGVPVATAIGRADGKKGTPRKTGNSWREKILCCLEWLSEWAEGKECKVSTSDIVTALMRSRLWTEPEAPGAAAPERVLGGPRTPEEEEAAVSHKRSVNREALRWSKAKAKEVDLKEIVKKSGTSSEWTFDAHAAGRFLKSSLANEEENDHE
jgi:hypothetical protein